MYAVVVKFIANRNETVIAMTAIAQLGKSDDNQSTIGIRLTSRSSERNVEFLRPHT
jgi:hypothetical protein